MRRGLIVAGAAGFLLASLLLAQRWGSGIGANSRPLLVVACTAAVVLVFAIRFETSGIHTRILAVVALLGTVSALLRIPFAAVPNLQPSTYVIICSGYVFGPTAGFVVGTLTPLVSNFFLGHGPWTLFQVLAWGLAGASSFALRRLPLKAGWLALAGVVWGMLFGMIMNLWTWIAFVYPLTARTFMLTWAASIPFDVLHAVGNALFLGLLGVRTVRALDRYRVRFTWVREDVVGVQDVEGTVEPDPLRLRD